MKRWAWLAVVAACAAPTAPRAALPDAIGGGPAVVTLTAAVAGVWDFRLDGRARGLWLFGAGGQLTLAVDSLRPSHTLEATRWTDMITEYDTTVATGATYALPCP